MMRHRMNQLLLDLYACPTDKTRWPIVLDQFCQIMRVRSAVVQILVRDGCDTRSRWMVRDSSSEAARELHDRLFSDAVNPRMRTPRGRPWHGQAIVRDCDFFEPDDPQFMDLQQRLLAAQLGQFMSIRLPLSASESLALVVHRDFRDREDFTGGDEQFALECMPHLRQAVQLATVLHGSSQQACDLREIVNRMRCALLLCNSDATVRWMNRAAENILTQRNGLWLNSEKLTAASTQETSLLRSAILKTAQEGGESVESQLFVLKGRSAESALQVKVQGMGDPYNASTCKAQHPRCALIMLSNPSAIPVLPAELLGRLFALSPAESRLTAALCNGLTLGDYACEHDIAESTARYQLKQIMAKTQVTRQAQLVQRVYSSVIAQTLD